MKFTTTLRLLLAVCALAGVIWLVEHRSEQEKKQKELEESLFGASADDIFEFTIERGDFHITCRQEKGEWGIISPLTARADEGEVRRILNLFEAAPKEEIITPSQRRARGLTLKDYGLLDHRARVVTMSRLGTKDLLMGAEAPLGELMYVMYAGGEDVMAVHRSLFNILPETVEKLRDRRMLHGETARTSRLEIQRPGMFIQLQRDRDKWMMRQPIIARADGGRITALLDRLYALKVSRFVWDPVGQPAPAKSYGLKENEALVRTTIWLDGDEVGRELIIGSVTEKNDKEVYARSRDTESIYAVPGDIVDAFRFTLEELRDKALFLCEPEELVEVCFEKNDKKLVLTMDKTKGWTINEPVQWPADHSEVRNTLQGILSLRARSFMRCEGTNLVNYGFEPPTFSVKLTRAAAGQETLEPARLVVGRLTEDGQGVYVRLNDSTEIMTVPVVDLRSLILDPVNPLTYRDRTMLAIPGNNVKRITLAKGGTEQTVSSANPGEWKVETPASTNAQAAGVRCDIVLPAIENILFSVANLRALRIEKHNPEDLARYGLDKPGELLTIGLAGGEGIQKSIMLGAEAGHGGRYAMVQGQDVVFVLDAGTVRESTNDIVKISQLGPEQNEEKE